MGAFFENSSLSVHQPVQKFLVSVTIARRTLKPILDCFIPNFKLPNEDSDNIKADRVSTVDFNLHQIKGWDFFGTPGI